MAKLGERGAAASDKERLAALDGVRCFALLYTGEQLADPKLRKGVLLQWWSQPALQGNTGVDAFFVLSGMLISSLDNCALIDFVNDFVESRGIGHLWSVSVEMQMRLGLDWPVGSRYLLTPLLCELIFNVSAGRRRRGAFALLGGLSQLSLGLRAWWVFGPPQMQPGGKMDEPWWPPPPLYTNVFARISPYLSDLVEVQEDTTISSQIKRLDGERETQDATMQEVVCAVLADGLSIVSLLLSGLVGHHYFPAPSFMGELLPESVEKLVVAQAPKKDAGLWGHFVPWYWCQQFLGASCFFRLALLSYSAYVMQFVAPLPLTLIDNRFLVTDYFYHVLTAGLDLSWAGLAPQDRFALWTTLSCLIALPYHAFLEAPGMRLGKRIDEAIRSRFLGTSSAATGGTAAEADPKPTQDATDAVGPNQVV
ncbi:hypothetical protein AK812_SmicGene11982 [Symbiodinium microadriaticum]|uniref:Uncharacterized protein n=1 Tax=Symbiodinium microadriaticum TaxID=2951 RepID=A0A1Q9EBP9_SYMMI|nr:hypothetical protein AK812_SmicGene11982 [Symbiodinium microadriaticum]